MAVVTPAVSVMPFMLVPMSVTMTTMIILHLFVTDTIPAIPVAVSPAVIFHVPDIPFIQVIPAISAFIVIITCRVAVAAAAVITHCDGQSGRSHNDERKSARARLISKG